MDTDLGDTIIALEGGVANMNLQAALENVEGWRTRLETLDVPHAPELRKDLAELAGRLARNDLNDIGDVLARLGQWTHAMTPFAPDEYKEDLARLADVLNEAGTRVI